MRILIRTLAPSSSPARRIRRLRSRRQDVAIRNATIITITNGDIQNGTIVVRNGKITAVGANVDDPGRHSRDRRHRQVRHAGHHRRALARRARERHQRRQRVGDARSAGPAQERRSGHLPRARRRRHRRDPAPRQREHDRRPVARHQDALGQPADSMYFKGAFRIVKFALGENVTRASSTAPADERRFPMTRMGVDFTLRYWFTKAKEYDKEWTGVPRRGEDEPERDHAAARPAPRGAHATSCTATSRSTRTAIAPTRS